MLPVYQAFDRVQFAEVATDGAEDLEGKLLDPNPRHSREVQLATDQIDFELVKARRGFVQNNVDLINRLSGIHRDRF